MTEQKKTRVVVLPAGSLHDDRPDYCGDCRFWRYSEERTNKYGRTTGECPKSFQSRYADESSCSEVKKNIVSEFNAVCSPVLDTGCQEGSFS